MELLLAATSAVVFVVAIAVLKAHKARSVPVLLCSFYRIVLADEYGDAYSAIVTLAEC